MATSPHASDARIHLRNLSLTELEDFVLDMGGPRYRYQQVVSWIYDKLSADFDGMTNLPLAFRERLQREAVIGSARVVSTQISTIDGTKKFLFELSDGALVESVLMTHDGRFTFCVSSQVGCPLDCVFCETGKGQFQRNLTAGEILDQICTLKLETRGVTDKFNIVFMGMGEPLMNLDALARSIAVLNARDGFDLGSRRITVSTAGLPRLIRKLADTDLRCSLALSLNATHDDQRRRLMPAVSRYTIDDLIDAARYFSRHRSRRVTLEYVLLKGINTAPDDARRLGRLARRGPFKVNLIPYNPGHSTEFEALAEDELQGFVRELVPLAPTVTVRRSKGPDIDAACGQLWTQSLLNRSGKKKPAKGT